MKRTPEEIVTHPLWMMPVFMLLIFGFIQGVHTTAHWNMEIDVHGYCMSNKEHLERMNQGDEDW